MKYVQSEQQRYQKDARRRSGVFIVNFEHISHLALVFLLLTLSRLMPTGDKVTYSKRSVEQRISIQCILSCQINRQFRKGL